jgi:hypothetical protein
MESPNEPFVLVIAGRRKREKTQDLDKAPSDLDKACRAFDRYFRGGGDNIFSMKKCGAIRNCNIAPHRELCRKDPAPRIETKKSICPIGTSDRGCG